uniref:Uncharacterized protein n=1 Tax=Oryza brachyantha TaxID=4533 RepID=J3L0N8_ORYBR
MDWRTDKRGSGKGKRAICAREGRLDEALAAVVRLARDSPGDSRPRFAAAALCVLHGRSGTAFEWIKSVPHKASSPESAQFFETILLAMPGSSPHKLEEDINWMWLVTNIAYVPADEWLSRKMEEAGRSSLEKLEIAVLRVLLRRLVKPKKKRRATATRLSPSNLNKLRGLHGILRAKVRPLLLDAASHEPPDTSSPH